MPNCHLFPTPLPEGRRRKLLACLGEAQLLLRKIRGGQSFRAPPKFIPMYINPMARIFLARVAVLPLGYVCIVDVGEGGVGVAHDVCHAWGSCNPLKTLPPTPPFFSYLQTPSASLLAPAIPTSISPPPASSGVKWPVQRHCAGYFMPDWARSSSSSNVFLETFCLEECMEQKGESECTATPA